MPTIVNLTAITISYRDDAGKLCQIPPSGWRLLASRDFQPTGRKIGEAIVAKRAYDEPRVPDPKDDTLYIVDPIVAEAMQAHGIHRDDVVVSHGASAEKLGSAIVASRTFYLANP